VTVIEDKRASANVRRLIASSSSFEPEERLDLLIHALAQLPDEATLDLHGRGPDLARLELLARAYGILDRVRVLPADTSPGGGGQIVYSSRRNLAAAPIRSPEGVLLDTSGHEHLHSAARTMAEFVERLFRAGAPAAASLRPHDEILANQRIVFVTNVPAPYRVELFERVAERLESAGASFDVVYQSQAPKDRPWLKLDRDFPFRHHYLNSIEVPLGERRPHFPRDLESTIARLRPTLLVSAGFSPLVSGRVARLAARSGIPFGIYSGETRGMPTATQGWRRILRRWIARRASFAVAYGFEGGEYLASLAPTLPFAYARNSSSVRKRSARPPRPDPVRILSTADLNSDRKGIDVLVDAMKLIPGVACELIVVGGGRLLSQLTERAADDPRIRFLGPLPREETLWEYSRSDVYAFPTRNDIYGLVMVEAMGSGLATVVSSAPGALGDLAVNGTNCLVVATHDPADWAEALTAVVQDHDLRQSLSEHGRQTIIRRWTIEHSVDAMIAGFRLGILVGRTGAR
jgi:glycosyltransferase involved in cell wall biosynthesis